MGYQIIQEPGDGTAYALFCSSTDTFVMRGVELGSIIDYFVEIETERIANSCQAIAITLQDGGKPYYQFTRTLDDALETAREHGGCQTCGLDPGCVPPCECKDREDMSDPASHPSDCACGLCREMEAEDRRQFEWEHSASRLG